MTLHINRERLLSRLAALAEIGGLPSGGVDRLAFTEADRQARDHLQGWLREAGLEVRIDRIGNLFGRWAPPGCDGPPIMTGSHIDSVTDGGRYDGSLGVLGGLEAIETLQAVGHRPRHPIVVGAFSNEEGARFPPDMMGSAVYQGQMDLEAARTTVGIDGSTVGEALDRIGYAGAEPIGADRAPSDRPRAFLELHVEQGPVLEQAGLTIGAVTGVQGIAWTELTLQGTPNHAGTTPMAFRRDPGRVAGELVARTRALTVEFPGLLGTVGHVQLEPNLVNVIPREARLTFDLRHTDDAVLERAESRLHALINRLAEAEGVSVSTRWLARFAPVPFDPGLVERVEGTAQGLGHSVQRLPSGAGHDAQMIAAECPSAMVFVPSRDGISHNPAEYTAPDDLAAGADVLVNLLRDLSLEED
jgi:N-carbamoyl-L-amino-acid hydrolase